MRSMEISSVASGTLIRQQSNEPEANNANYKTIIREMKMKTSKYIFLSLAVAFVATACNQEMNPDNPNKANPGDEVQFGLSLPGKTKTVYGEETSTGFPIYWVNGDKVKVASPQCQSGRNNAEYAVSVKTAKQSYADTLKRTGEYGVQWGSEGTADFYSIYPSTAGTALNVNDPDNVTAKLHVDATQFANTTDKGTSFYSQPAEMGNVVMYAKATASKTNGSVELHYTPFSTVLEFMLTAPAAGANAKPLIIQSITLTAANNTTIAGDFEFSFPATAEGAPSIVAKTGGSNTITMHFLEDNQYNISFTPEKRTMKAKMCLMPISGVSSLVDWKVEVNTSAGTFIKTLKDSDFENEDGSKKNTALVAGKVHKITLPSLNFITEEWKYEKNNWIQSLPDYKNIYLSELSLPGAWYAGAKLDDGYQNTTDINELWRLGVRAFAFECRSRSSDPWSNPNRIVLSGTGSKALTTNAYIRTTDYIAPRIKTIADNIKTNEYGVLVLSYADGGEGGTRPQDYSFFLAGVQNEITQSGATNIYSEKITPETTVEKVLGKLIIVVAVDNNLTLGNYTGGMNSLICYNPFPTQLVSNGQSLAEPHFSKLYWKSWANADKVLTKQNTSDLLWCFTSANRTDCRNTTSEDGTITNSEVATLSQRKKALSSMGTIADQIYDASSHNVWFYFGAGGTSATSKSSQTDSKKFAKYMNPWLLQAIKNKVNLSKPSPLGIVMFNQCGGGKNYEENTYHGAEIIKNIIEMNSKFYLKHAGTSGGSTGGSTGGSGSETAQNDVLVNNGGDAI